MNKPYTNTGHGHVWTRPDGVKAKCGGIILCEECKIDEYNMLAKVDEPKMRSKKEEYDICRVRGHVQDPMLGGRTNAIHGGSSWYICKYCGTSYATKVTTEILEQGKPE